MCGWTNRNSTSSKFAKSIITRLTNKQNLGGTRLVRGYPEVEELTKKSKAPSNTAKKAAAGVAVETEEKSSPDTSAANSSDEESTNGIKVEERQQMEQNETEDYDNENSEEPVRKIDHLMFVIHG